ncbi:hypothetical protein EIP91_009174 [Steccherinum ochraceum]|uniref:Uncharacterized protein n=1 Tax=Steccherinum ochraceum TaxID=92696 RepID=A0A4R0RF14_9APHY|nr:hypothetical protein EIP91_009174 [Steccherinum ochraceum]
MSSPNKFHSLAHTEIFASTQRTLDFNTLDRALPSSLGPTRTPKSRSSSSPYPSPSISPPSSHNSPSTSPRSSTGSSQARAPVARSSTHANQAGARSRPSRPSRPSLQQRASSIAYSECSVSDKSESALSDDELPVFGRSVGISRTSSPEKKVRFPPMSAGSSVKVEVVTMGDDEEEEEEDQLEEEEGVEEEVTAPGATKKKIPKPAGEAGRPNSGGYNLQDALNWPRARYDKVNNFIKDLVVSELDSRVPFSKQVPSKIQYVRTQATSKFPCLLNYERSWAADAFIRSRLKYMKFVAEKNELEALAAEGRKLRKRRPTRSQGQDDDEE